MLRPSDTYRALVAQYPYRVIDLDTAVVVARFDNLAEALAYALDNDPESNHLVVR